MRLTKFLGGLLLVAAVAYLGYLMDIPMPVVIGISATLLILCLATGL